MNKALSFPFGFSVNDNSPLDGRYMFWDSAASAYRPYNGTAEVLTAIPSGVRHPGLTVRVLVDTELGTVAEYSFKDGIADGDLVEKGAATSLPPQIQTAKFENLNNIMRLVGNMGDPGISGQFFDVGGLVNWTAGMNIVDLIPEDALFDADSWDTVSPIYWFVLSGNGGIHRLDVGFTEDSKTFYPSNFGSAYTGEAMTSGNVRKAFIDKVNRKMYFITSETTAFYIFDYVNNTIDKRTFTAAGTTINIAFHESANKVVILTASGSIIYYNLTNDTTVVYSRTSGNYTGDLLPNSNPFSTGSMQLVGNILWVGGSTSLNPTQNIGLWKFDLGTNVSTKVLNNTQYSGLLTGCGPYGFYRTSVGISRIEFSTGIIKTYTFGVTYTGDLIDANATALRWSERENKLLMISASTTNPAMYIFDIATEVNTRYYGLVPQDPSPSVHVGSYSPLMLIPDYQGAFSGNVACKRTSATAGIPLFLPLTQNLAAKYTYDQYGLKVDINADTNRDLIGPYNLIHRKYIDELKSKIDLVGISQHAIGVDTDSVPGYNLYSVQSDASTGYYQDSHVALNFEEVDLGGLPTQINLTLPFDKPKMSIFFIAVNTPSILFTGIDQGFDPLTFIFKDSSGSEWDGTTQTFTPVDGKLYKFTFYRVWLDLRIFVEWEVYPTAY